MAQRRILAPAADEPIACTTEGRNRSVPLDSLGRLIGVLKRLDRPVSLVHGSEGGHATNYDDACEAYEFMLSALAQRP